MDTDLDQALLGPRPEGRRPAGASSAAYGQGRQRTDSKLPSETLAELLTLDLTPPEAIFDGGFTPRATVAGGVGGEPGFIVGSKQNAGSRRTHMRLASHRVGCGGRISHLKRKYGADWSRLKGGQGAKIWAGSAALAYDLDTIAARPQSDAASD